MADVTKRRTGEMVRKLFEILLQHPDGLQAAESVRRVADQMTMSPYEAGNYDSGGRRFDKILRFATVDCVKAGWLVKNKGTWTVTDAGREAYQSLTDPEEFYGRAVKLYWEWKSMQPEPEAEATETEGVESRKAVAITFEVAEEQAWAEIDQFLRTMPPYEFQELAAALIRAMGYHVAWIAPPGKDGGIDILAWTDPLGTKPPRLKVQVKRQSQAVNVEGLRSFMALLGDGDVGIFISIGGFTKDAAFEARTQEKRRVTLIDLETLVDLWVEHYGRLSDEARRRMPMRPIYFLAPTS
ncbi:MAG: Mrr restriction system protein [Hyphomicrobiaceae bacterium]|nr:MAG: Mrr restriction system protein [Hyphomicrobiaceae bacterium]